MFDRVKSKIANDMVSDPQRFLLNNKSDIGQYILFHHASVLQNYLQKLYDRPKHII